MRNLKTIVNLEINDSISYIYQAALYNMGALKYIKIPFLGYTLIENESNPWVSFPSQNQTDGFYCNNGNTYNYLVNGGIQYYKAFSFIFGESAFTSGSYYQSYRNYQWGAYGSYGSASYGWHNQYAPAVERVVLTKEKRIYTQGFANIQSLKSIDMKNVVNLSADTQNNGDYIGYLRANSNGTNEYQSDGGYNNENIRTNYDYAFYTGWNWYGSISLAFYNCTSLDDVEFSNDLKSIQTFAFYGCKSLTHITIPENVTTIGISSFAYCTSLETARIENKIIGVFMFRGCTSLTTVSTAYRFDSIAEQAFTACTALKNFLYDGCGETEGFHLSPNVQIGFQAFNGCTAITNVHIVMEEKTTENGLENAAPYVGTRAFIGCTGIESLIVDGGEIGYNAFVNCTSLETVEIKSGIVGYGAFSYFYYRNGYSLHDTRTSYNKLTKLVSVTLDEGVTKIYQDAFIGTGITSIVIPASVEEIGKYAFGDCDSLTSATVKNKIIAPYQFAECDNLESVYYDANNLESVGSHAFGHDPLMKIFRPYNLNDIKGYNESDYKVTIDGVEDFFDVIILSNITTGNGLFTGYSTEGYADDETNYSNNGIFNHETQNNGVVSAKILMIRLETIISIMLSH